LKTQFTYVDKQTITITTGSSGSYIYTGNSLYDPNQTGTGNQPQMFDELMTFYGKYNVIASKIKVVALTSSNLEGFDLYLAPTANTSSTYNFVTATTIPGAKWIVVGAQNSVSIGTMTNYRRSDVQTGLKWDDITLSSVESNSPESLWYWRIGASPNNPSSTLSFTVFLTVYVTYYTLLSSPLVVAQS